MKRIVAKSIIRFLHEKEYQSKKKYAISKISKSQGQAKNILIGNAIPKSGTYLLNSIFREIGKWVDTRIHLLDNHTFHFYDDRDTVQYNVKPYDIIPELKGGQLTAAHLHYSEELKQTFVEHPHVRHVFMYRDPRDIFVSYMNFCTYSKSFGHWKRPRKEQDFMRHFFSNDDDRLSYVIPKIMERENWHEYAKWIRDPSTFSIKFETLYKELVDCKKGEFGPLLKSLFDFIGIDVIKLNPIDLANSVLGKGFTSSGIEDKIEQFKRVYKPTHYGLIDSPLMDEVLNLFGYEKFLP